MPVLTTQWFLRKMASTFSVCVVNCALLAYFLNRIFALPDPSAAVSWAEASLHNELLLT